MYPIDRISFFDGWPDFETCNLREKSKCMQRKYNLWGVREEFGEGPRQQKEGAKFTQSNYQREKNNVREVPEYMRIVCKSIDPLKDMGGFEDADFMGFSAISTKILRNFGLWKRKENEGQEEIIYTYSNGTKE